MKIIGITGGIGSGKTVASDVFRSLNFPVIDTDQISRKVVEPGRYELEEIKDAFGPEIMNGSVLDRRKLGKIVFSNAAQLAKLDRIMEPAISQMTDIQIDYFKHVDEANTVILDVPLLFEKGWEKKVDTIIVIDAPLEDRINRVMQRNGISRSEVINRINAQIPLEDKVKKADVVFSNDGDLKDLETKIKDYIIDKKLKP